MQKHSQKNVPHFTSKKLPKGLPKRPKVAPKGDKRAPWEPLGSQKCPLCPLRGDLATPRPPIITNRAHFDSKMTQKCPNKSLNMCIFCHRIANYLIIFFHLLFYYKKAQAYFLLACRFPLGGAPWLPLCGLNNIKYTMQGHVVFLETD